MTTTGHQYEYPPHFLCQVHNIYFLHGMRVRAFQLRIGRRMGRSFRARISSLVIRRFRRRIHLGGGGIPPTPRAALSLTSVGQDISTGGHPLSFPLDPPAKPAGDEEGPSSRKRKGRGRKDVGKGQSPLLPGWQKAVLPARKGGMCKVAWAVFRLTSSAQPKAMRAAASNRKIPKTAESARCGRAWAARAPQGAASIAAGAITTAAGQCTKPR